MTFWSLKSEARELCLRPTSERISLAGRQDEWRAVAGRRTAPACFSGRVVQGFEVLGCFCAVSGSPNIIQIISGLWTAST